MFVAPGLVKGQIARINFEKRQGNYEMVRDLYSTAYQMALRNYDVAAVTYITCQYARFMAHKCQDL